MEIINDLDIHGKLKIIQDNELNSYTFDSVLLAYFTSINKKDNNIIDFCTGNAPVAMLLTLKKENIKIKAIELQSKIYNLGKKSIMLNDLSNKIEIINEDVVDISNKLEKNFYDIITCNPPYFRIEDSSNINENTSISIARHEIKINLEQIIKEAKKLLNNTGKLVLVHRPDRLDEIIILLNKYNFSINKIQFVYPKLRKDANTVLIEAKKGIPKNNKMKILAPIYVYNEKNEYSEQAKDIMFIR